MGFGIALFGYASLLALEVGGGIFAAPLLAYGFFLASRLEANFFRASIAALFLFPRGVLQLCVALGVAEAIDIPLLNAATFVMFLLAWLMMTYYWLTAVINIARECNVPKLERQASSRLAFTAGFLALSLVAGLLGMGGLLGEIAFTVTSLQFILQYVVILVNIAFLHTCFVLITSEKQYEKDKQQIAKEAAAAREKALREKQERLRKAAEKDARKK
jgi:signal transduction histidine kinase